MGLSPTVNGQTGRQNNYTMDGGNNNELYRNIWAVSPPPDAIQEFKVQTNTVDASIYATGANVNVVTKSGGNQIHGDAWEFFRNSALDSTPFFTNFAGAKKGEFQMNQYGFTIGGPLMLPLPGGIYDGRKAKTYFFGYWEGFRSSTASTQFAGVPTSSELGGNFSDLLTSTSAGVDDLGRPLLNGQIFNPYSTRQVTAGAVDSVTGLTATTTGLVRDPFPGNIIPSSLLSTTAPTSLAMIHAFYPSPNFGPGGNSFPNYSISSPDVVKNNQLGVKIDHTFSNNDTLTGSFYLANPSDTGPNALLIGPNVLINHGRNLIVGYTHMISPSTLLTVHYNYVETNVSSSNVPAGLGLLNSLNQQNWMPVKDGIPEVPSIGMSPRMTGTSQWAIPEGPNRSHIFSADLQKVAGKHTFSAGGLLYHMHGYADGWFNLDSFDQRGSGAINTDQSSNFNTGDGLASMLLNLPQQLAGFLGKTSFDGHTLWQGYYVSDKWAVSKSLTLTVGVRYDVVPPSRWLNDQVSGWSASCSCFLISTPFGVNFPFANVRKNYFDPRDNGFQPRFGLAYKITPKLVYRSGFAMFQDHGSELIQEVQNQRIAWPWGVFPNLQGLNAGIPQMQYTFSNPPSAASFLPNPGDPTAIPSGFSGSNNTERTPVTISWNGGIEAQINCP